MRHARRPVRDRPIRAPLVRDRRGATLIEFALILPALLGMICVTLELGYKVYLSSVIQGALLEASRAATVGDKTGDQIDALVKDRIAVLTSVSNVKSIKKERFYNFSNVGKAEKITQDIDPKGVYNKGDCYEDANNSGTYDAKIIEGIGTADDIIRYTVVVEYPDLIPVATLLKWAPVQTITASTMLRNQPYTSRAAPTIRCD